MVRLRQRFARERARFSCSRLGAITKPYPLSTNYRYLIEESQRGRRNLKNSGYSHTSDADISSNIFNFLI